MVIPGECSRPVGQWFFHTVLFALAFLLALEGASPPPARAADTPDPSSVTIAGSLQSELGCPGDWQPDCAASGLAYEAEDDVWQAVFTIPAGSWEYKAALNGSWEENYGAGALRNGPNVGLSLAAETAVKFYYSHQTHWVTDGVGSVIATAPGSYQSELGCPGDWDPGCLRSWLQDPDGDGVFTFRTRALPAGGYEAKVAIAESWDENYGAGGVQNGTNVPFTVPSDCAEMLLSFDWASKVLTIGPAGAPPQPASVTAAGSFQSELGCPGDWQPDCTATGLAYDAADTAWQAVFSIPAGSWEYKAALNGSWDENYGANATPNGPNIGLALAADAAVKLYYSDETHWVTSDHNAVIATAPGSFQSELGCPGDWDPGCLRSWLQDPDGDGTYRFSTFLPAGSYEAKVAIGESWDENYGEGGVQNGTNVPFTVPASCTEVFFTYDAVSHLLAIGTGPGGPVGNLAQAKAHWVSEDTLAWDAGEPGDVYALRYDPDGGLTLDATGVVGGSTLTLSYDPAGLPGDVVAKFPHLAGFHALKLDPNDLGLVPEILKGQIAVSAAFPDDTPRDATSVQVPGVLDDLYTYGGALGAFFEGSSPVLRLWAPTARSVTLHLFDDSGPATPSTPVPMVLDPSTGVWSAAGEPSWDRRFYLYEVEVYAPSTRTVERNFVTDPYSLSLAMDSRRSQIVDLDDPALEPPGWSFLEKPPLAAPEDIVLYELHVRDFSIADETVPEPLRGKFPAFAVPGSDGMRHLAALAEAGLTHVHVLPSFDVTTVPEDPADREEVDPALLATYPPDSEEQQALVSAVSDRDGFNWGYDPWHYTVPEGSYATDPDGAARVRELREMVQGLAGAGLRVVLDVVYNHTNAAGQNAESVLDRIVPGYYHRLSLTGAIETSSCCPNTASEHAMMEKLLVDSVVTWAKAYKVDGFRFDLMGHHMKSNLLAVRVALDALTPEEEDVDGSSIYVYGEGWNFGEVADDARGVNATQRNMAGTGIGTFSDRLRDAARGGSPFSPLQEQGFLNGLYYDSTGTFPGDEHAELLHRADWIRIGLAGDLATYELVDAAGNLVQAWQVDYFGQQAGYTADPQENIKYIAAHDNETLFDTTQLKAPVATSMADRVRVQNLGASLVALGQGIPFFHAGQDVLRSKSMDRDSYDSGDWWNALDWSLATSGWGRGLPVADKNQSNWSLMQPLLADSELVPGPEDRQRAFEHVQEVLRIRKGSPLFRLRTADEVEARLAFHNTGPGQVPGLLVMSLTDDAGDVDRGVEEIVVLFNARTTEESFAVPALAGTPFGLHPVQAASSDPVVRLSGYDPVSGTFTVPARTTAVFVAERPVAEQLDLLLRDVAELVADGALNGGQGNALSAKLEAALQQVERGNLTPARGQLQAFVHQVEALLWTGVLTEEEAKPLLDAAGIALGSLAA
jgi:pullulanase-type alpha-1,6-glucosidase